MKNSTLATSDDASHERGLSVIVGSRSQIRPVTRPYNPSELAQRQEFMDLEAQILELLLHLRTLKAGQCRSNDGTATDMAQLKAEISNVQVEIREDLAALGGEGDETTSLRRHMNEHFTSHRRRCCKDPAHDRAQ
ncbi:hypothetical protein AB0J35_33035 [Nonomuraea angiospora]|uniref:hypothetical protein n=1 Tax=Nonomuraea angiospora TaxID=46172 RepID=UPI0034186022